MPKIPFNISILKPEDYIQQRGLLPVTNHAMFESSSNRFHPDGLFSEVIFGQIGSTERLVKRGYIDLRCKLISPYLFKQLMSLKSFYQNILAGKEHAIFDKELKDFIRVPRDDDGADTGYTFFMKHLDEIELKETNSSRRSDKIALIEKYRDRLTMDKLIVIPAGVRDVKETNGRMSPEEINKYYLAVLSLSRALPEDHTDDSLFDGIKYQMQMKIQTLFTYLSNLMDGKGGFAQSKYAARNITYATRNVITSAPTSKVASADAPNKFSVDEVMLPLYQAMKNTEPLVINKLKTVFFDQIFNQQTTQVAMVNPETLGLEYVTITSREIRKFTTSDGIRDFINGFRNTHIHTQPVGVSIQDPDKPKDVKDYYLYLVYDDGESIYPFRNLEDFKEFFTSTAHFSTTGIPHITELDMFNKEDIVIFGSAALNIYGRKKEVIDIDIIVSDEIVETIKEDGGFVLRNGSYHDETRKIDLRSKSFIKENLGLDISFEEFKEKHCVQVGGFYVIKPEESLRIYQNSNRIKDKKKIDYLKSIVVDLKHVRPLTYIEMCYIACEAAIADKPTTATRYPILNLEGIVVYNTHLTSTSPGRVVKLKSLSPFRDIYKLLPEYPILGNPTKQSMSPHPSTLERYDGREIAVCRLESYLFNPFVK